MSHQQFLENQISLKVILRRLLPRLLINALLPFILYHVTRQFFSASDVFPLLVAALPPLLLAFMNVVRKRSFDVFGIGVLAGLIVGIALSFTGADPRWLLLRESFFTGTVGVVCLLSLFFARPLVYWAVKYLVTGGTLSLYMLSDAVWQQQSVRSAFKLATFVVGIVLVLEVLVRAYLVFTLNVQISLIVLPVLFQSLQLITILWCVFFLRAAIRRGRRSLQQYATFHQSREQGQLPTRV